MKMRLVYTVIRECRNVDSAEHAREETGAILEETGEYLYGGSGSAERVGVAVQVSKDQGKTWTTVEEKAPE